jgi:hypothetical protein
MKQKDYIVTVFEVLCDRQTALESSSHLVTFFNHRKTEQTDDSNQGKYAI